MVANEEESLPFAGFWRRAAAYTLDWALISLVLMLVAVAFGFAAAKFGIAIPKEPDAKLKLEINLVSIVACWLYFAGYESGWRQATPGKQLMGLRVTGLDGERISYLRATGRYFARILSAFTLLIGYLMMLFTERKQTLHDKVAGTLVVQVERSTPTGWTLFALVTVLFGAAIAIGVRAAIPVLEAAKREAAKPAVVRVAERAADAVGHYGALHHELPVALEDTTFVRPEAPDAPLVSIDPESARLTVTLRDGSVMLVMTPWKDLAGNVSWTCSASPDEPQNYPERCRRE